MDIITMAHGSGGLESSKLIEEVFYSNFNNEELLQQNDSTILNAIKGKIAITTDSFVVDPIFFKGGDIGKLSVCGTVNDLAVSGARPL
ncbi:MAG: AIR synthase related protein, partial [Clostridium sp.]